MNQNEIWKEIGTSTAGRKTYLISNMGRCKTVENKTGRETITRGRKNRFTGYLTFSGEYVHRLVAQHFIPRPDDGKVYVVAHKNTIKEDCRAVNLSWSTPTENNRNRLTCLKRAVSNSRQTHAGQIIKAEKNGQTLLFKNGMEASKALNRSHVLIYNALNKRQSARKAAGWDLSWVAIPDGGTANV